MKYIVHAGVAALMLYGGVASAQMATETTTTQTTRVAPPLAAPPAGAVTTQTSRTVDAYGNEVDQRRTIYSNGPGVAADSRTVTTTVPAVPPPVTTTTTTTTQRTTTNDPD